MTLKQNLIDRSLEIKMKLEAELRALDKPCSLADMTRRVGCSRLPIEKHLTSLLQMPEFNDLSMIKIGTYDVIYRRVVIDPRHEALKAKLEAATMDIGASTVPAQKPPEQSASSTGLEGK